MNLRKMAMMAAQGPKKRVYHYGQTGLLLSIARSRIARQSV